MVNKRGFPLLGALLKTQKERSNLLHKLNICSKKEKLIKGEMVTIEDKILENSKVKSRAVSNSLLPKTQKSWMATNHHKWIKRVETEKRDLLENLERERELINSIQSEIDILRVQLSKIEAKIDIFQKEKKEWEKKERLKRQDKLDEETAEAAAHFTKPDINH